MEREQSALEPGGRKAYGTIEVDIFIDCSHDSLDCEHDEAYEELREQIENLILDGEIGRKLAKIDGATFWLR